MAVSKEQKIEEAVRRMRKMNIFDLTIKQFKDEGFVSISEPPFGILSWVDDETKQKITELEEAHECLVYMVIRTYTTIGTMDSFFYVSDYEDEWKLDNNDLAEGLQCVYVHNYDAPECSEFGTIGFKRTAAGGVVRTY